MKVKMVNHITKKLRNSSIMRPLVGYGKRLIYNPYYATQLKETEFPSEVWIENTNICNAECVMCPREKQTRPLGMMKFTLFERLIKEISNYKKRVKRVHMHNYGEPLLDKELPKRIKMAKDCGIQHVFFVTNASLLTQECSREIIGAGLDEFKISFYGTDKKTYNDTMKKLDYDRTLQNIKEFIKIRKEMKALKPKIVIQYLPFSTNESKTEVFFDIFNPIIDKKMGDSLNVFALHNFGDGRAYHNNRKDKITSTCYYPWRTMVILHDGRVVICCLDYDGVQVMGNVNNNTIKEIWNSEQYVRTRNDFKKLRYGNYPICTKCNVIR